MTQLNEMFCGLEGASFVRHNNRITGPSYGTAVETNYWRDARRTRRQASTCQITAGCRNNQKPRGTIRPQFGEI